MLRRRILSSSSLVGVAASAQCRWVTTKGQFNPIHDFSVSFGRYDGAQDGTADGKLQKATASASSSATDNPLNFAKNEKEFETLIANPGPLRVGYSPDYLNWLYLAYKNKVAYEVSRRTKKGYPQGQDDVTRRGVMGESFDPSVGRFSRPASSFRRRAGEAKKAASQEKISRLLHKQGLYDLVERQPQFPFIDLANATRFHYVELFKDLVLNYYNSNYFNLGNAAGGGDGDAANANDFSFSQEVWDKALLYRAILEERKNSYPEKSFRTVFDAVKETNLVPMEAASTGESSRASPLSDRCPTEEQYLYFRFLVKKYFVENAVEGHVVLKAHRQPNAAELLFSSPPPKDDNEVALSMVPREASARKEAGGEESPQTVARTGPASSGEAIKRLVHKKPGRYPPIEALWRCEENLPLLKILVFGELNLFVSENPFTKFPNSLAFLTRPYASALAGDSGRQGNHNSNGGGRGNNRQHRNDVLSLANLIAERRGSALAPFPRNVANLIDGKNSDIRRQQQRFHREDILAFSKVLGQHSSVTGGGGRTAGGATGSGISESLDASVDESNAFFYGAFADFNYYNPRTTRAEKRDYLARKSIDALKEAKAAEEDVYRDIGIEEAESMQQFSRNIEGLTTLPVHLPTLPHYLAIIRKDPHVSYLLHANILAGRDDGQLPQRAGPNAELERLIFQLARALANTAMNFHKQAVRRVNKQKANVAAALLDNYVNREIARAKQTLAQSTHLSSAAAPMEVADDQKRLLQSLGEYRPFENRALDDSGYFTDARVEDYKRWMAAP